MPIAWRRRDLDPDKRANVRVLIYLRRPGLRKASEKHSPYCPEARGLAAGLQVIARPQNPARAGEMRVIERGVRSCVY
jgi:hypothetical protein